MRIPTRCLSASLRLAAALALAPLVPALPARAGETRLVVLHTTDLHGALDGWDYAADRAAPRGLTRIATLVRRERAGGTATLLLDDGDCLQGGAATVWARSPGGRPGPMMTLMSALGYDAMAVGNHEFDFGMEALERARRTASFPWLAANVVREDGGQAFDPSLVRTIQGIKVGVVGLCTPAVPKFTDSTFRAGLRFLDPVEPARREVERLRRIEGCDVVLLLAHTGLERDPQTRAERRGDTPDENWGFRLAQQVRGVDAIILGHTHVVVPWARIDGQLVTQAGKFGEDLGRIEFRLRRSGERGPWAVMDARASIVAVTDSVPEDSALAAIAAPYHEAARAALDSLVGRAALPLTAPLGRLGDGPLWGLIQRAQLAATGADLSLAALPDPGAEIPAGPITRRMLLRLYPYENTLGVVLLSGAEVKQVLEKSASLLSEYTFEADRPLFEPDAPAYNFDAMAGVSYRLDLTRPVGERVVDLRWRGSPIPPARTFKVAVNSYREFGGGGYPAIPAAPRVWQTTRGVRELIADYCAARDSLEPGEAPQWSIAPAQAVLPERGLLDLLVRREALSRGQADSLDATRVVDRRTFATWLGTMMGSRAGSALPAGRLGPERPLTVAEALEACERAARGARYRLAGGSPDRSFRRSLLTGTSVREGDASLTAAQALGLLANLRFPTLRLLETTDFHGAILSTTRDRDTNRMIGGSAALAGWIERLRAENPEGTVLLDGGDCYQGTMISNLQFGRPVVEQMNALGYTAAAIGNHEFDWTADTLVNRVVTLRCASLAANMVERRTGRRPRWARADTVVTRRGFRIGVLGLAYRETPTVTLPANVAALRFDDDSTTAARAVPDLRRRADVVVGIGHIPAEIDSSRHVHGDLWRDAHVPGFDVWFGGHSHNRVLDWCGGVPLMIAGAHGEVVGVCDVVVDGLARRAVERRPRLQLTFDDAIAPDSVWQERIALWNSATGPIAGQKLCRNARRLGRGGGASLIGSLVADAMRAEAKVDVAMQNSGGLRADLAEGDVTRGSIYEVMPVDNTLFTLDLTAQQIRDVLEEGLAHGRVTQVSGIRYWFDMTRPPGDRVTLLAEADGQPLDQTFHYRIVVNNFMATGGDNYDTLMKGRHREDTGINVRDALERYVVARAAENGGVLDYRGDERIRRNERPGAGR